MDGPTSGLRVLTSADWPRVTVQLAGELDVASVPYLHRQVVAALSEHSGRDPGPFEVVVDVAGVSFVDITGIGGLLDLAEVVGQAGGALVVRRPTKEFTDLVEMLGVAHRLPPAGG